MAGHWYDVTRTPVVVPPNEENGVPVASRRILQASCTCRTANGSGQHETVLIRQGTHIDEKGRKLCQVHNPQVPYEWDSRTFGGLDTTL
jgi:hypothetical protein